MNKSLLDSHDDFLFSKYDICQAGIIKKVN